MENYYESLLRELLSGGMNKSGGYAYKRLAPGATSPGGEFNDVVAGAVGGGADPRRARQFASEAEDAQIRGAMSSKRELGKNERKLRGSYAMSWYPGQQADIDMAPGRVIPADAMVRMSPEQRKAWEQKMLEWQNAQRSMVPQHGSGFIKNLLGGR